MCPFCIGTMGLIIAGSVSTGGLAALAVKLSRKKNKTISNSNEGSNQNVSENSR